jgi:hypothetical protein
MKTVLVDGRPCKLQIWDTAGLERFRAVTEAYFRGSQGVLICYDVCSKKSFDSASYFSLSLPLFSLSFLAHTCTHSLLSRLHGFLMLSVCREQMFCNGWCRWRAEAEVL